jgi:hypothetical protein
VNTQFFLTQPTLRPDRVFEFQLNGVSNRSYSVEFTTDFTGWTNVTNITLTNAQTTVSDGTSSNAPARFYRVRQNP